MVPFPCLQVFKDPLPPSRPISLISFYQFILTLSVFIVSPIVYMFKGTQIYLMALVPAGRGLGVDVWYLMLKVSDPYKHVILSSVS